MRCVSSRPTSTTLRLIWQSRITARASPIMSLACLRNRCSSGLRCGPAGSSNGHGSHGPDRQMLLSDPATLAACAVVVILVGMAKGGFSGLGALGTPVAALALPPSTAAAILLPILIVQDVVSVWSFRHAWDKWIVGWMLPGAMVGIGIGWAIAASIDEKALMGVLGGITLMFGLYRLWIERGNRVAAASASPGWVGALFGMATGFTSQVAHAGGPPFQMWVTPRKLPHLMYAGTNAILFAAIN